MKRRCIFYGLLLLFAHSLNAQSLDATNNVFNESYGANGKPFAANPNAGLVEGSPMLNDNWGSGVVKLANGREFTDALFQFNLVTQKLFFKKDSTVFAFTGPVISFTINYVEKGLNKTVYFKNNYPPFANQTSATFYQVLTEGNKFHLLKLPYKKVEERYEYNQPLKSVYRNETGWYIYEQALSGMKQISNNLNSILKALPGQADKILASVSPVNRKHLTDGEMLSIIEALNK